MPKLGIRLNNPGNIEKGEKWQGLADLQAHPRFCTFVSPEYGIRAIVRILQAYNKKHRISTIDGIIKRWAPPNENPTDAYQKNVSTWSGIGRRDKIDFTSVDQLAKIVKGIIRQENGIQPYLDETVIAGVTLGLK